ncbi:MAG: hypothetical protein FWH40_09095, partial [Coriobacteriia bacterium]|nr:hypothetical protein [Coriobacteriia bacterium]
FSSSAHEIRHTYQWETVQGLGCHIVSDETREAWLENYQPGNQISDPWEDYAAQPLEYDAFMFAAQGDMLRQVGVVPVYPGSWE